MDIFAPWRLAQNESTLLLTASFFSDYIAGFAGNGDHFTSTNSNGFALSYAGRLYRREQVTKSSERV
jgi:hypothetical protein